jgi:hypothetical protein
MPCGLLVRGKIVGKIHRVTAPFTNTSPRPSRYIREFLNLEQKLTELNMRVLNDMERLLKVVLADGALYSKSRRDLIGNRITALTNSYLQETTARNISRTQLEDIEEIRTHSRITLNRCVILTEDQKLGLTNWSAEKDDVVAVLHGSGVPIILRNIANNLYEVIGQAYIEDIMSGNAVTWEEDAADEFILV